MAVVELEILINGTQKDVVEKLKNQNFQELFSVRTIANYYLPPNEIIFDSKTLKEKCIRMRKSKKFNSDYKEGFKIGNYALLDNKNFEGNITSDYHEKEILSDEEIINIEQKLLKNGFKLIYTDDKVDMVYYIGNKDVVFQIQDIKNIGLILAYDNEKYYHLDPIVQKKSLLEDVYKCGIDIINEENVNRFQNFKHNKGNLSVKKIIEILKNDNTDK